MSQFAHIEIYGPAKRPLRISAYDGGHDEKRGDLWFFISSGKRAVAQITLKLNDPELAHRLSLAINKASGELT